MIFISKCAIQEHNDIIHLFNVYLLLSLLLMTKVFTIQNFIKGSAKLFRVWKGFVTKLN